MKGLSPTPVEKQERDRAGARHGGTRVQVIGHCRQTHNGLELSCRASRIRFRIGRFSAAGPVSCSELLCVLQRQASGPCGTDPPAYGTFAASAARRRLASQARPLGHSPRLAAPAPLRRSNACELNLARDGSLDGMMPWLAGTPSPQSLAPSSVPGRDTRCSPFRLDRQALLTSPIAGEADQHGPRRATANQVLRQQWPGQHGVRRRAAHNGLELSCPAARATVDSFSRIPAGKSRSNFPHASRVSCSELLCGLHR